MFLFFLNDTHIVPFKYSCSCWIMYNAFKDVSKYCKLLYTFKSNFTYKGIARIWNVCFEANP